MKQPVRVLHILKQMNPGGIETWLLNVLRNIDSDRFKMDILVHSDEPGVYDDEVRALGSQIIPCSGNIQSLAYAGQFRQIIQQTGPYDVIHSHTYLFSGQVLKIAAGLGIPVRIAHIHNTRPRSKKAKFLRHIYDTIMRRWINRYATHLIYCSPLAGECTLGIAPEADPRITVLPCGVDLSMFSQIASRNPLRAQLGLPADALVVGHVGSFTLQKNHDMLLRIFQKLLVKIPHAWLLLVGDGPRREEMETLAAELGITQQVIFAGIRRDVPQVLQVMDIFVMPSTSEGAPVAGAEAQAVGLPCIFSEAIPDVGIAVETQVTQLSSRDSVNVWVDAIIAHAGRLISVEQAVEQMRMTPLALDYGIKTLEQIYSSGLLR